VGIDSGGDDLRASEVVPLCHEFVGSKPVETRPLAGIFGIKIRRVVLSERSSPGSDFETIAQAVAIEVGGDGG